MYGRGGAGEAALKEGSWVVMGMLMMMLESEERDGGGKMSSCEFCRFER